jgi:peptidoglycan/LPS O-acetylase OafA/YrhL
MVLWSHSLVTFLPELGWARILQLGNVAVCTFFVLSGFLMSEAMAIWYSGRPGRFITNRYLRITPPFLVAALFSSATHLGLASWVGSEAIVGIERIPPGAIDGANAREAITGAVFPLNLILDPLLGARPEVPYAFVRYSWAIWTEMIFYWALFAHAVAQRGRDGHRVLDAITLAACVAAAGVGLFAYVGPRFLGAEHPAVELARDVPFAFHLQWTPHFVVGVFLSRIPRGAVGRGAGLCGLGVAFAAALLQLGLYAYKGPLACVVLLLFYSGVVSWVGLLAARVGPARGPVSPRLRRWDRALGNLSYPIYLNHYALAMLALTLHAASGGDLAGPSGPARAVAYVVFNGYVVGAAWLLIQLTDRVTDGIRDRVRGASIR